MGNEQQQQDDVGSLRLEEESGGWDHKLVISTGLLRENWFSGGRKLPMGPRCKRLSCCQGCPPLSSPYLPSAHHSLKRKKYCFCNSRAQQRWDEIWVPTGKILQLHHGLEHIGSSQALLQKKDEGVVNLWQCRELCPYRIYTLFSVFLGKRHKKSKIMMFQCYGIQCKSASP